MFAFSEHCGIVSMSDYDINDIIHEKGLKLVHINARSALGKMEDICTNIGSFDAVIFTETWLKGSTHKSITRWPDYNQIRVDRSQFREKRGGGICIYIKSQHKFEEKNPQTAIIDKNIEIFKSKLNHFIRHQ